jgi:hypothetical protein
MEKNGIFRVTGSVENAVLNQGIWDLAWWCTPVIPTLEKLTRQMESRRPALGPVSKQKQNNKRELLQYF